MDFYGYYCRKLFFFHEKHIIRIVKKQLFYEFFVIRQLLTDKKRLFNGAARHDNGLI